MLSVMALFETIDHAIRSAEVKSAEAFVRVPLIKPVLLDDEGKLPGSDERIYRLYARQWVRQGIAYYREVYPE